MTSKDPFGPTPSWQVQMSTDNRLDGVECASTALCISFGLGVTSDDFPYASLFVSQEPTGGPIGWHASTPDRAVTADRDGGIAGISCQPEETRCVAVDQGGDVVTSH